MKKLLFSAIAVLFAGSVFAQGYYPPAPHWYSPERHHKKTYSSNNFRPSFMLIGAANFANTVSAYNSNYQTDTKVGVNAGVGLDLPINYPLSFDVEALYSQKGYSAATPNGEINQQTNYIDIPLLLKFHVFPGFNFLIGPQISFLLGTHNNFSDGFSQTERDVYNNSYDGYSKTLIGSVAGISVDVSRNVEIRGRYTLDITPNNENGNDYVPSYRNQVWQLGLAVKL